MGSKVVLKVETAEGSVIMQVTGSRSGTSLQRKGSTFWRKSNDFTRISTLQMK